MNVDPALFQKVLQHVKKSSKISTKGQLTFNAGRFLKGSGKDALEARQVVAEIRRMGDIAASDVIQRPSIGDTFIWADSGKASMASVVTQYQTFGLRSLEKKFLKGANRIRNRDIDEALQLTWAMGLAGMGVVAFTAIRGQTIRNEEKRREFYKNTMGYNAENGEWDLSTLAVGALKRSSYMAAPAMVYDTIGTPLGLPFAGLGRTTRETELDSEEKPKAWRTGDLGETLGNFPALKFGSQLKGAAANTANLLLRGDLDEDQVERQKIALLRNLKGILPNDPVTQGALGWLMEHGMYER